MDASEEYLEDKLNLKIDIKEENDILSCIPLETASVKDEPFPVDLNKVECESETSGIENETNYFVTDSKLRSITDIKTEDFQIKCDNKNDTAYELQRKRKETLIEDVEINAKENYSYIPIQNLKYEPIHSTSRCQSPILKPKRKRHESKDKCDGLTHKPSSKEQTYNCDLCDFKTVYKMCLTNHQRKHKVTPVEVYKCDFCEYKTIYKYDIIRHQRKHKDNHEEQLYKCNLCAYTTTINYI